MTETTERSAVRPTLGSLNVAELKGVASSLGIAGTAKMRKGDLVAAIEARQGGSGRTEQRAPRGERAEKAERTEQTERSGSANTGAAQAVRELIADNAPAATGDRSPDRSGDREHNRGEGERTESAREAGHGENSRDSGRGENTRTDNQRGENTRTDNTRGDANRGEAGRGEGRENARDRQQRSGQSNQGQSNQGQSNQGQSNQGQSNQGQSNQGTRGGQSSQGSTGGQGGGYRDDDDRSGRRRSRQRGRKRGRGRDGYTGGVDAAPETEVQIAEDDVLVPVAGILDVMDNYAFVRTSGYLPGPNDIYVPLAMVKKFGLRKGDAMTGAIKAGPDQQQHTHNRQKYTPLARLDTVNGGAPEASLGRAEFQKLTPLYPQQRLRLETASNLLTTRIIDLVAPIGKGQRGLINAPAKAGKTMVMQAIANAITTNNPEVHLMVVLVDERPEEVTDMQRAVKGEVIASTFDRPADDHTTVAELAIERAKRLVEMGHDVVVLLDSITKLGRAYNLAAPASGRILSGGVDSAALYPPKRFFGAARNIENGGSLTILATALVETGSKMDEVIFEEFKGTGNMELKLDRQLANRRIFPAVDVNNSGTRREEILLANEELKIMWKLRRVLAALDSQQSIELLIDRLKKTKTNYEFLMQVQQNSSIKLDDED